jgi:type IV secretory pathway protease TraF
VIVIERPGEDGAWSAPRRGPIGRRRWVIKRVAAVPGDPRPGAWLPATRPPAEAQVPAGKLVLLGDNPDWSNDSRQMGYFPAERLLGVVVRRIARGHDLTCA